MNVRYIYFELILFFDSRCEKCNCIKILKLILFDASEGQKRECLNFLNASHIKYNTKMHGCCYGIN